MAMREQSASASSSECVVSTQERWAVGVAAAEDAEGVEPLAGATAADCWKSASITFQRRRRDSGSSPDVGSSNSTTEQLPITLARNSTCSQFTSASIRVSFKQQIFVFVLYIYSTLKCEGKTPSVWCRPTASRTRGPYTARAGAP